MRHFRYIVVFKLYMTTSDVPKQNKNFVNIKRCLISYMIFLTASSKHICIYIGLRISAMIGLNITSTSRYVLPKIVMFLFISFFVCLYKYSSFHMYTLTLCAMNLVYTHMHV